MSRESVARRFLRSRRRSAAPAPTVSEMLALVINHIPQYVFWKDRDSVYLGCNENFARGAGLRSAAEIVGKTDYDLPWTKEESDSYREYDRRVMDLNQPQLHIMETQRQADGRETWVDTNKIPLCDASGQVVGILGTFEDMTERRQAELALRQASHVVENSPAVLFRWQAAAGWPVDMVSRNVSQFGYTAEELLAGVVPFAAMVHPDDMDRVGREVQDYSGRGIDRFEQEYRILTKDGRVRWVDDRTLVERDGEGRITFYQGILMDITERKEATEALDESRRLLKSILDTIPVRVFWKDRDLKYLGCNKPFALDAGLQTTEEILGRDDYSMSWVAEAELYRADDRAVISSGIEKLGFEEPQTRQTGEQLWLRASKVPLRDASGSIIGILGTYEDITARIRAEQDLKHARNYIVNIINSMPSVMVGVDEHRRVTQWNAAAQAASGLSADKALGMDLLAAFPALAGEMELIAASIRDKTVKQVANRPVRTQGGDFRYEDITIFPLVANGASGAVIRIDDVTRQYTLEEQLHQSRKMDAIGQLAGGVAHDFNNMLGAIIGAAEIIRSEDALDPEYDRYLEIIQQAASHTADLTSKLLTFGRKGKVISTAVDVHAILGDTVALLERSIDKRIRVFVEPLAENHAITGDNAQLQNALLNLGINASHAMPEGGELHFSTSNTLLEAAYCSASSFRLSPGEYLEVEVRDTGCGIPVEHLGKIFDPFFTTKEHGKGTGLGLSAVYGTVLDHHGAISVYSEVGRGTAFHLFLPVSEDLAPVARPSEELIPGTGLILLADDEEIMRVVAGKMLRNLQYEVITADNGAEAVRIYQERHAEIDLVILDMIMPEMSGRDAFERIKAIEPACKVILSSGFSRGDDLDTMKAGGLAGFIRKPFRISELSQAVSKALSGPGTGTATPE